MGKYAMVVALLVGLSNSAFARDDGRYANDTLKHWFDNLTSSNGNCCSFADGLSISDVDWETKDGHYRVLLHGEWINVPNSAVVTGSGPPWTITFCLDFPLGLACEPLNRYQGAPRRL
jgi:hypothetical protein